MKPTDEELRYGVAKSLGWKNLQTIRYHGLKLVGTHQSFPDELCNFPTQNGVWCALVPRFEKSLDDCSQFEDTLTDSEWDDYFNNLIPKDCSLLTMAGKDYKELVSASPRRRCIAYLVTKNELPHTALECETDENNESTV